MIGQIHRVRNNTHACMHSSILLNQMQIFAHLEEAKQNRTLGHIFDGGRSRSVSRMQRSLTARGGGICHASSHTLAINYRGLLLLGRRWSHACRRTHSKQAVINQRRPCLLPNNKHIALCRTRNPLGPASHLFCALIDDVSEAFSAKGEREVYWMMAAHADNYKLDSLSHSRWMNLRNGARIVCAVCFAPVRTRNV